ncbi:MAG: hypothetical protein QOF51_100 [Chloroflexota bacterium]|jgi:hypothetical protein|nr:hypothetical protein [Chloroflexota bacterium]
MAAIPSIADRKAAVLADLRAGRELFEQMLPTISKDEIYGASQWGVVDAINHTKGDPSYYDMVQRTLAEDRPQFPAWAGADESWEHTKAEMLASIDRAIAWVEGMSEAQLQRVAVCGTDEVQVIQFLEWAGPHYLEHGRQIRDEILPLARGKQS